MRPAAVLLSLPAIALSLLAVAPLVASAAQESEAPAAALIGTLRNEGEPLVGVTITVADVDGAPIGTATSDDTGAWRVELPGPGRYIATLDATTLPAGLELPGEQATREILVLSGQQKQVLYRFGGQAVAGGTTLVKKLLQGSLNGIKLGLIIAMTAVGLSLIFGTTGMINFAHGELVSFGAVIAWFLNTSGPELHIIVAGVLAVALGGLLGGVLERGMWRPLRVRKVGLFQLLVISIGLSLVFRNVLLMFFGGRSHPYVDYTIQQRMTFGPFAITARDLTIMVLSAVILVGIATALQRTRIGKAMRAVSDNRDLAASSGIDIQRVILFVWIAGAALAATGGLFLGVIETVNHLMGFRLLLLMFAGVILGGLGTAYGALLGSLAIGLVTEVSTVWISPELKYVAALVVLIGVLLLRPQGILGSRERVG